MSNALKFTPSTGTVTIIIKESHVHFDNEVDNYHNLTDEEVVLVTNSQAKDSNQAFTQDIPQSSEEYKNSDKSPWPHLHDDSADSRGTVADTVADETTNQNTKSRSDCTSITVDGKEYKKYGQIIISFVDTGAGIAKVLFYCN